MTDANTDPGAPPTAPQLRELDVSRLNRLGEWILRGHASERLYMVRYLHLFAEIAPQAWAEESWAQFGAMLVEKLGDEAARGIVKRVAEDLQQMIAHMADSFASGAHCTEHYAPDFAFTVLRINDGSEAQGSKWRVGLTAAEERVALAANLDANAPSELREEPDDPR